MGQPQSHGLCELIHQTVQINLAFDPAESAIMSAWPDACCGNLSVK